MGKPEAEGPLRLNRFLARAGLGARREVESLITDGVVSVNGRVVTSLGNRVDPRHDRVTVHGKTVRLPHRWSVYAFHKPFAVVSTLKAQKGQPGLAQYRNQMELPAGIVPVGRLDAATTGLLLWTDDGDLAQALCRPASHVWKRYVVRLDRPLSTAAARTLRDGRLELDDRPCLPVKVRQVPGCDGRRWILELREGRKRQIRRMLELLRLKVLTLKRTAIGPVNLGRLRPGCFRRLRRNEERALRRAAGRGQEPQAQKD